MKPIFPTAYSTLSPEALGKFLSKKYGFNSVDCRLFLRGVGDTYMVYADGNRFVLRIYRNTHRSLPQIEAEVALLLTLKEAGVSVASPVADLEGNAIQAFAAAEGTRYGVLFNYARGKALAKLDELHLRNLGVEMAKFHNISSTIMLNGSRWEFNLETTLFKPLEMLQPNFAEDAEGYAWLQHAANFVQQQLYKLNTAAFSKGYCHFDFLPKNFHFDEAGNITFFDFDFFGYGWLANDIMTFWQHLCLDVHFGKMQQEDADKAFAIFVEAYRSVRPLSDEELEALPYLALGFWLFYMAFHTTHDQFYPFVQPAHLKLRVDLVKKLMTRYWGDDFLRSANA
jgi:Ser/Thr protein kinase RdoA (MazF antagonist)